MPNQTLKIAERSIETMSKFETKAALAQTYKFALEKNMGFHMSYIGDGRRRMRGSEFETEAMRDLYAYGLEKARNHAFWQTKLPQIEVAKDAAKAAER